MKNSTLCYIARGDEYLMLHRIKKENDENKDKWIGIGGKLEEGESPLECVIREASEEVGLKLIDPIYTRKFYNQCNCNIDQAGENSSKDNTKVAERSACRTCEGGGHGSDKCEGRSEEHGTAEFGEKLINKGTDAGTKESRRCSHSVSDDCGNGNGCCHDSEQLLDREDQQIAKLRLVVDVIDQILCHEKRPPNNIFDIGNARIGYISPSSVFYHKMFQKSTKYDKLFG